MVAVEPLPLHTAPAPLPPALDPERDLRIEELLQALEHRFGPGVVVRLAQARPRHAQVLPTGSLALDRATGLGGVPRGHLTEFVGPPSSGKTTLALLLLAETQRTGGLAVLLDADHAAEADLLDRCGVDRRDLVLAVPRTAEEALEVTALLLRSGGVDALVLTSLGGILQLPASTRPPRLLARALPRLHALLRRSPTALVATTSPSGATGRLPRGPARPWAALSLHVQPLRPVYGPGGDVEGLRVRVAPLAARLAPPGPPAELTLRLQDGLHRAAELVELGLALGVVERTPLGLRFARLALGATPGRAVRVVERDPALAADLARALRARLAAAPPTAGGLR